MDDDITRVTTLFVYGTLTVGGVLHERWCGDALTIERASTTGRLYDLPLGFPAMIRGGRKLVHGQAMTFPDLEATLDKLDLLEGYDPEHPRRSMFLRRVRPVGLLDSGNKVRAYCYFWRGRLAEGAVLVPSGRWTPNTAPESSGFPP